MNGTRLRAAQLWPRRAAGLPPGQRRLAVFPRFAEQPRRPPPAAGPGVLAVRGAGLPEFTIGPDELAAVEWSEQRSDFHCVTTWTHQGLRWGGVSLLALWREVIEPRAGSQAAAPFVVARGADGYRAVFHRDDLLRPDVLLARTLDGVPLDARHGAPLRLISPSQYGYKSVKHLVALELRGDEPRLGAKEHLRARVAAEERHSRVPGTWLRVPYRLLIPITALVAERSAASSTRSGG